MRLTNYVAAMDCWKGRVDSTTDYDVFAGISGYSH